MGFAAAAIPFLTKAAPAIGGLLGGIGSSGTQGKQTSNISQDTTSNSDIWNRTVEPEYWTNFRKGIMTPYMQQLDAAQKPVYGQAQIADTLGKYNALYDSGIKNLRGKMARYGRGNSGAFDEAATTLGAQKLSDQTGFMSQLPFLESQAKEDRMAKLLGLGASWSGQAPSDTHQTGTQTSKMTGTEETTKTGPSWWQNSLYGLGGMMMRGFNPFGTSNQNYWDSKSK